MDGEDFKVNSGSGAPPGGGFSQPPKFPTPPPIPPRPAASPTPPAPPTPPIPPKPSTPAPQPDFISQEALAPSPMPSGIEEVRSGGFRTVLVIFLALAVVSGVGALGYFYVFPALFPRVGPISETPPADVPAAPAQLAPHQSYLILPAAAQAEILLGDRSFPTVVASLQNEAFAQLADGQVKEVKISDRNGQVPFKDYLPAITPAALALDLSSWFEDDFTALLYYNPAGVWPVYVAKIRPTVDYQTVISNLLSVEGAMDAANFYLTSPGSFSGFKDGKYKTYNTRYNVGSVLGASFNYGVFGNYLVIATNFDGLKAVLPLLGL